MSKDSDVIEYSTPKLRKNFKYDLAEPSNYKSLSDQEKFDFCVKRAKNLNIIRDSLLYEISNIEQSLKDINENINQLNDKNKKKDKKEKEKEKEKEKDHKKKKDRKSLQCNKIFGIALDDNYEKCLEFIRACIKFVSKEDTLKSEGIFRISVVSTKVDDLARSIEDSGTYDFEKYPLCQDPFLVPCLMKKFFRELQDPLFTFDCYTCFLSASGVEDVDLRMKKYRDVISMFLSEKNKIIIKELCDFLFEVQKYSAFNKMSYGNLGTCFGPSLLRDSQDYDPMSESIIISQIVAEIIEHKDYLFSQDE